MVPIRPRPEGAKVSAKRIGNDEALRVSPARRPDAAHGYLGPCDSWLRVGHKSLGLEARP